MTRGEWMASGLCVVALLSAQGLGTQARPALGAPTGLSEEQREKVEHAAMSSLFGQFRTSMADFLWLEVDKYLHNGVELRAKLAVEKKDKRLGDIRSADAHDRDHGDETTKVPARNTDWRGILGEIERVTQPYQEMKNHKERDPKEAIPLFRLMTWSNPKFVPGYVHGAMQMASVASKRQEALTFLLEGARNNPESIVIQTTLCELYLRRLERPDDAEAAGVRAIELARQREFETLSEEEHDAYRDAYRWLVLIQRDRGDLARKAGKIAESELYYERGRALATEGDRLFALDPVFLEFLKAHPARS